MSTRTFVTADERPPVSAQTTVGIELDGNTATFVVAYGARLEDAGEITASSPGRAIAEAAHRGGRAGSIVVAWATKGGVIRQLPFPIVPRERGRAVLDALAERAAVGGLACARLGGPIPDGNEVVSVVGGAPKEEVDRVFGDVRDTPVHLVLAPMVISTDGVWLGVRRTGAELTVVEDHLPRLSRILSCGGLDRLSGRLGAYGGDGSARLATILTGRGQADVDALGIADDYVTELCSQVHESLNYWRRSERLDVSTVFVHGHGANLPTVEARLAALGITGLAPPESPGTSPLPPSMFGAAQAALSHPDNIIGFPDLAAATRRAAVRRAAASGRRAVVIGVVTGIAGLALATPVGAGRIAKRQADIRLAGAIRTIRRLGPEEATYVYVNAGARSWTATATPEPDWAMALESILKSAPPTTRIETLTVEDTTHPGYVTVTVQAAANEPTLRDLHSWATTLQSNSLVSNVFSTSAGTRTDQMAGSSFEIQFDVSARGLQSPRPLPGTVR